MQEIIIENKQKYLDENYPFTDTPNLSDQKLCIHCDKVIKVGDYKVITKVVMNLFVALMHQNAMELSLTGSI